MASASMIYDVELIYHSPKPVISSSNPVGHGNSACPLAFNPSFIPANPPYLNKSGCLVRQCCDDSCHGHGESHNRLSSLDADPAERIGFAPCDLSTGVCGDVLLSSEFNLDPSSDSEDPRAFLYDGYYYNFYFFGDSKADPKCKSDQCTVKLSKTKTPLDASSWQRVTTLPWHRNGCCIMRPRGQKSFCVFGEGPSPLPGLGIASTTNIDSGEFQQEPWAVADGVISPITNDSMWLLPLGEKEAEIKLEAGTHPVKLSTGDFIHFYAAATPGWVANGNYTVGFIILDGKDPRRIIQRSKLHLMIPTFPYETLCGGNASCPYIGERKNVIFLSSATRLSAGLSSLGHEEIRLFFGGGDGNVGTGLVQVSRPGRETLVT